MEPDLTPPTTARQAMALPWQWPRFRSIRHKLLTMALGPLLVVFPLLVVALVVWGNVAYDRLLVTKVRSDLSVAHGYFDKVLDDVGQGTQGMAMSYALVSALSKGAPEVSLAAANGTAPSTSEAQHVELANLLERHRHRQGLDFMRLYALDGQALV